MRRNLRPTFAAIPWRRISFATVSTQQGTPLAVSSAWTRGLP